MNKVFYLLRFWFIGFILAFNLIACATDNTPQPQAMPKITNSEVLKTGWVQSRLLASSRGSFVPVDYDNAIWTSDSGGYIYKIDPSDGSIIKKIYIRRDLSSGIAVGSSLVFVTSNKGYLLAVDKVNGKIKWSAQLPTIALEAPQVNSTQVLVRTNDAELLAYSISDGKLLWVYQKPIPPLTLRVTNSFLLVGDQVVALGLPGGKLSVINVQTGSPIWENYIAIPQGATDLDKMTDVGMKPLLDNRTLYCATYNGKLVAIDIITSNIYWQKAFNSTHEMAYDEQNVYAVTDDGVVYAFDKSSGAVIWTNNTLQYRKLSGLSLLGNGILLVDDDGNVHMFNRNTGDEVARISTVLGAGVSIPLKRDNGIIYQSANGYLVQIKNY